MASSETCVASVEVLLSNPQETFLDVSELLLKFANNILNNPDNPKYRKVRVGNRVVQDRLLPVSGAIECLFEMGFEEDGEYFTFPTTTLLDSLREVRDELAKQRQKFLEVKPRSSQALPSGGGAVGMTTTSTGGAAAAAAADSRPTSQLTTWEKQVSEAKFFKKLQSSYEHVLVYEDPSLQQKARSCIPVEELRDQATKKLAALKEARAQSKEACKVDLQDMFLLELLAWFKHSFFRWVDAPACESCGGKTQNVGTAVPTPQEVRWGAGTVENYLCSNCKMHTRFPRYNSPEKLLETREGRCGEWANCFTLCCRATGFDARYVLDWTDHVWTEVYSESEQRWLHCDPCENTCDKPLQYEAGWGKKLSYILAFSRDDIQDVTWRYSAKHSEVRQRRQECRENWLVGTVFKLRLKRQTGLPEARKQELQKRLVAEIVEFMMVKTAGDGELTGRTSGSQGWRMARGELGTKSTKTTVIKPTEAEKSARFLHLKYSCAADQYIRVSAAGKEVKGCGEMTAELKDVVRKEENDWKMVYLARREGTTSASISWKFDFQDSGLVVDKVEVQALSTCFENGQVFWQLCGGDQCTMLPPGGPRTRTNDLAGSSTLTITANLSQGQGDVAWQHTQLFRQKLDDQLGYPFEVKIWLK